MHLSLTHPEMTHCRARCGCRAFDGSASFGRPFEVRRRRGRMHPKNCRDGIVYFIEAVGAERIKIGHSKDPKQRLQELRKNAPFELRLLGMMNGGEAAERRLHHLFAAARRQGEWFEATSELRAFIDANSDRRRRLGQS